MISVKVCSFTIAGTIYSEMYDKAQQRIRKINSCFETTEITFSFKEKRDKETQINTLEVTVYSNINEKKLKERFCDVCKEFHCNFYINTRYNCEACEYAAYQKRLKDEEKKTRAYAKSVLKK